MALSNILVLICGATGYLIYSRNLSVAQFGLYGIALSVSRFLTVVVDGGMKISLIKDRNLVPETEWAATLTSAVIALLIIFLSVLIGAAFYFGGTSVHDISFVIIYSLPILITYPLVVTRTARLERQLKYGDIAAIESSSMIVELLLPAVFVVANTGGIWVFILGVFCGRLLRLILLLKHNPLAWKFYSFRLIARAASVLREGLWIQSASLASAIRDNLPTLIIAPIFGKTSAAHYIWALQLCSLVSQTFVAAVARVALPIHASSENPEERRKMAFLQIQWLMILLMPVFGFILLVIRAVDKSLFLGKWEEALVLLPFLFARMIPAIVTTSLGSLLLVTGGARSYFRVSLNWSIVELLGCLICVYIIGPKGLAGSYAILAWVGVYLLMSALSWDSLHILELLKLLLLRPSLWVSLIVLVIHRFTCFIYPDLLDDCIDLNVLIPIAVSSVILSWASESKVRTLIAKLIFRN